MINIITLEGVGTKELSLAFVVEMAKVDNIEKTMVGSILHTKYEFERYKSLKPLRPFDTFSDGQVVPEDQPMNLYTRLFRPYQIGKRILFTAAFDYTLQWRKILSWATLLTNAHQQRRNQIVSDLYNFGFSDSAGVNSGMNAPGETLFGAHQDGVVTQNNLGNNGTPVSFGPSGVATAKIFMRSQKDPSGNPMNYGGNIVIHYPPALDDIAWALDGSGYLVGSNNNDISYANKNAGVGYHMNPYLTNPKAYFATGTEGINNRTFLLEQQPLTIKQLPMNESVTYPWVAWSSCIAGWLDWRNTWASNPSVPYQ